MDFSRRWNFELSGLEEVALDVVMQAIPDSFPNCVRRRIFAIKYGASVGRTGIHCDLSYHRPVALEISRIEARSTEIGDELLSAEQFCADTVDFARRGRSWHVRDLEGAI